MELSRRGFLGAAVATAIMPIPKFTKSKPVKGDDFNPDKEYGNIVKVESSNHKDTILWDKLKKIAYNDMLKVVPPEWRYRVQFRTKVVDFGRCLSLAWYYPPSGKKPVICNGKYICHSTTYLPLPVHNDIGDYGII